MVTLNEGRYVRFYALDLWSGETVPQLERVKRGLFFADVGSDPKRAAGAP
jgi:hypothetical protein